LKEIEKIQQEIIADFQMFDNAIDQYEYIIDLGKELKPLDDLFKIDNNVVKGCQSVVWLRSYKKDDKIYFEADSNTVITKGIIALLIKVYSGQTAEVILNEDLYFIDKINLRNHLSSQRSNGLSAMIKQMKYYALSFSEGTFSGNTEVVEEEKPKRVSSGEPKSPAQIEMMAVEKLKEVYDPEIPVNIYELGLIYEVTVYPPLNNIYIKMTVTAPNCPVADSLPVDVRHKIEEIEQVADVEVEMTFDPPWEKEMMSEEAMLELGMF